MNINITELLRLIGACAEISEMGSARCEQLKRLNYPPGRRNEFGGRGGSSVRDTLVG